MVVTVTVPPGQHRVDGFPRFGTHLHHPPPPVPAAPAIEVSGAVAAVASVPVDELASLPRRALTADFHCVAGWTATDLRWEGVAFVTLFRETIESMIAPGAVITHVEFRGLDGFRSILTIDDALVDDVLIADRLGGRPLTRDHGAPVRLVSPQQYGFMSTKHLCRIALHTRPPKAFRRPPLIDAHPRARVWEEERHRYLPAKALRPVYRMLIPPFRLLSARGSRDD
jgi:DMSO/TMAO reductase YedYZ molybdopterin-dependent catalytic subunit